MILNYLSGSVRTLEHIVEDGVTSEAETGFEDRGG